MSVRRRTARRLLSFRRPEYQAVYSPEGVCCLAWYTVRVGATRTPFSPHCACPRYPHRACPRYPHGACPRYPHGASARYPHGAYPRYPCCAYPRYAPSLSPRCLPSLPPPVPTLTIPTFPSLTIPTEHPLVITTNHKRCPRERRRTSCAKNARDATPWATASFARRSSARCV